MLSLLNNLMTAGSRSFETPRRDLAASSSGALVRPDNLWASLWHCLACARGRGSREVPARCAERKSRTADQRLPAPARLSELFDDRDESSFV
jgi:hypothetical protein